MGSHGDSIVTVIIQSNSLWNHHYQKLEKVEVGKARPGTRKRILNHGWVMLLIKGKEWEDSQTRSEVSIHRVIGGFICDGT